MVDYIQPDLVAALAFSICCRCSVEALRGLGAEIAKLEMCDHDRAILRAAYVTHMDFLRGRNGNR